jgi:hypothetical protein
MRKIFSFVLCLACGYSQGATNINEGKRKLAKDEVLEDTVSVFAPAILSGTGKIKGPLNNQGIVAPGSPKGALTVNGTYSQYSKGALVIHAKNAAYHGKLIVTGQVQLAGTLILNLLPENSFRYGDEILILDNTGSKTPISGAFTTAKVANLPSHLAGQVLYNGNKVFIKFTHKKSLSGGLNQNDLLRKLIQFPNPKDLSK